ncbi:MAG: hypothetical protein ACXWJ6_15315, partial [Xanthobacteraceae bacterium]
DFIRTFYSDLASADFAALVAIHDEMLEEATGALRHRRDAGQQVHLDIRYVGQEFTLSVPVGLDQLKRADRQGIRTAFDKLYEHRYAHHSPDEPVEMVNIRLAVIGERPRLKFPSVSSSGTAKASRERQVYFGGKAVTCPVYDRPELGGGAEIVGPAIVQELGTTTVLFAGDKCRVVPSGELIIEVGGVK